MCSGIVSMRHMYSISSQASHYHSETTDASLSIFWVELQYFAQLYMKQIDTLIKHKKKKRSPFLVISAAETPRQPVPCQMPQWGRTSEEKKIITIIWWLLRYDWHQNKEQSRSHCAFVFNFPQVFNHNMWHLLLRGLCWERDGKKAHVALFVVFA